MGNEDRIISDTDGAFDYTDSYGDVEKLYPVFSMYRDNDNLYLEFNHYYEDEAPEFSGMDHYCTATVNLYKLPFLQSTIDTNNNGDKMLDFLEKNGFGKRTGLAIPSGYCIFPVFEFNADKIKELDPDFFKFYAKKHGIDIENIDSKIEKANKKSNKQVSSYKVNKKSENIRE